MPQILGIDLSDDLTRWVVVDAGRVLGSGEIASVARVGDTAVAGAFGRLGEAAPIMVDGVPYGAEALVGRLLAAVVEEASARLGDIAGVALVHADDLDEYRRSLLLEAARMGEVAPLSLVPRSVATAATPGSPADPFATAAGAASTGEPEPAAPSTVSGIAAGITGGAGIGAGAAVLAAGADGGTAAAAAAPGVGPIGTPLSPLGPSGAPLGPSGAPLGPSGAPLGPSGAPLAPPAPAAPPAPPAVAPSTPPPAGTDLPPSTGQVEIPSVGDVVEPVPVEVPPSGPPTADPHLPADPPASDPAVADPAPTASAISAAQAAAAPRSRLPWIAVGVAVATIVGVGVVILLSDGGEDDVAAVSPVDTTVSVPTGGTDTTTTTTTTDAATGTTVAAGSGFDLGVFSGRWFIPCEPYEYEDSGGSRSSYEFAPAGPDALTLTITGYDHGNSDCTDPGFPTITLDVDLTVVETRVVEGIPAVVVRDESDGTLGLLGVDGEGSLRVAGLEEPEIPVGFDPLLIGRPG